MRKAEVLVICQIMFHNYITSEILEFNYFISKLLLLIFQVFSYTLP